MTNNMATGETAKRAAGILAWIALALSLIASVAVVRAFRSSDVGSGSYYFLGLPLTLAIVAVGASRRSSTGSMWAAIGGMIGFVIVGAFSLGPFFVPAALALLGAGVVQLGGVGSRWRTLTGPLWALVGIFAIPVAFLITAVVQRLLGAAIVFPGETREFDAPRSVRSLAGFEIIGSWLFIGALAALLAAYSAGVLWKRRAENRRLVAAGAATLVIAIVLIELLAVGRAIAAARRGQAFGCESSGAKTTCWSQ